VKGVIAAAIAGMLAAAGLLLSGMTVPDKVTGFLDFGGAWDPTLMFVMAGSIMVLLPATQLARRRTTPLLSPRFHWPTLKTIDRRLIAGSALFGVGWGLSGYCGGPAIISSTSGIPGALVFVIAMIAGGKIVALASRAS